MKAVLFRTRSGPIRSSFLPGSPRFSIPVRHDSFSGGEKVFPPLLHLEVNNNRRRISRAISEPEAMIRLRSSSAGSQTFPEMVPEVEEECLSDEDVIGGIGSLNFEEKCFDRMSCMPASGTAVEELQFPGVGSGSGRDRDGFGTGRSSGGSNNNDYERDKIGAYYQQMLNSNPNDPLLLRNYGKFLQEVGDTAKAEEFYGRAILASPGDGELLSLYGKLIWDTQRDGERAKSYFDQAAAASPDDCMVMGSCAQFMWESEEDEDENDEEECGSKVSVPAATPMVAAF